MFRGWYRVAMLVIAPKFVLAIEELGKPYCTWFKELNMSARTMNLCPSHGIVKAFIKPKSSVFVPSRKNVLRPTSCAFVSADVSARNADRGSTSREFEG